jgi:hypothetical protein
MLTSRALVFVAGSVIALGSAASLATVADAAIVCKDGFQRSGGDWISTPYCNDAELARVARKHGVRVSDAEMRANPARKYEICRFLSGSLAARDYCPGGDGASRGR